MQKPGTEKHTADKTRSESKHEEMYEVILYNDDVNDAMYVARCLMRVFNHDVTMAVKIMVEAHNTGRAIAEVEGKSDAINHKQQLIAAGLTAEVERI
jgi:ATP-dependent Clp protease adapter protein ClpS